jgi:hypothetical protein
VVVVDVYEPGKACVDPHTATRGRDPHGSSAWPCPRRSATAGLSLRNATNG